MKESSASTASILLIIFVVLKLTGCIDWSWLWVLSPLWIPAAFVGVVLLLCFIIQVLGIGTIRRNRN